MFYMVEFDDLLLCMLSCVCGFRDVYRYIVYDKKDYPNLNFFLFVPPAVKGYID